jgi:hypothetical protein
VTEECNALQTNRRIRVELTLEIKEPTAILKLDIHRGCLLERVSVIEVKAAEALSIQPGGNDELEALLAQHRGCHRSRGTDRDDTATAKVDGDMGNVNVPKSNYSALAVESDTRVPVKENVVWEVGVDRGGDFFGDGADKKGIAIE